MTEIGELTHAAHLLRPVVDDSRTYHEGHLVKLSQIASLGLKFNLFLVLGAQDPKIGNLSGLLLRNVEIPVDPYTLALYFHDQRLSIAQARQRYHLSRTVHTRHRNFARELAAEIRRLGEGQPSRSPHYLNQGEQQ